SRGHHSEFDQEATPRVSAAELCIICQAVEEDRRPRLTSHRTQDGKPEPGVRGVLFRKSSQPFQDIGWPSVPNCECKLRRLTSIEPINLFCAKDMANILLPVL